MTEKRFTFYRNEEFDTPVIYDKEDEVYYFCVDLEKIVDVLNEQHESNMLLIEDTEQHRKLAIQFDNRNKELVSENALLEKENERLKQSNNEAIELILDGIVEMHDGKRDYAEIIFNKAIKLLKGDAK